MLFRLEVETQPLGKVSLVFDDEDAAHAALLGKLQSDRGSLALASALGRDFAAMRLCYRAHDEETQAGALHLGLREPSALGKSA